VVRPSDRPASHRGVQNAGSIPAQQRATKPPVARAVAAPNSSRPLAVPSVSLPPVKPRPRAVEGPGGCDGVEAAVAATHTDRLQAARGADPSYKEGRLGNYLFLESPYDGWIAGGNGPVTRYDVDNGTRQWREPREMLDRFGWRAGYARSWTSERSWQVPDGAAVVVLVYEFGSVENAVAFDEESAKRACQQTKNTFTLPTLRGELGLSIRDMNAPVTEEVTFVRGARRYVIGLELARHTDYDRVYDLVEKADLLAR
jgi:hypothetical protein